MKPYYDDEKDVELAMPPRGSSNGGDPWAWGGESGGGSRRRSGSSIGSSSGSGQAQSGIKYFLAIIFATGVLIMVFKPTTPEIVRRILYYASIQLG